MTPTPLAGPPWGLVERYYLRSPSPNPPLRIGLMLDSPTLPRWQAAILDDIVSCDFAALRLVVRNALAARRPPGAPAPLGARLRRLLADRRVRQGLLYDRYTRWDRRRFAPPEGADPFEPIDCSPLLAGVPALDAEPLVQGFTHRFRPEDVATVRAAGLDVILRWGFNIVRGEILEAARYGVWSYHHGDNDFYRGGPPAFWELYERTPTTGVLLQVLSDELDGGLVLDKALVSTRQGVSTVRNRFEPCWLGQPFVIRKLWELHAYGWDFVRSKQVPNDFRGRRKVYRRPTNGPLLRFVAREALRSAAANARWKLGGPRRAHWRIGLRRAAAHLDPAGDGSRAEGVVWLDSPRGHFYADPFLVRDEGRDWLFFEDFRYDAQRGAIACAPVEADLRLGPATTALELPDHLSYPFVFRDEGVWHLMPEMGAANRVDLYRAVEFPLRWEKVATLAQGFAAYDVTLYRHGGLYWFFATVAGPHGARYGLYLFHADSLTGEWRSHPANPICQDVRRARGAGAIFDTPDGPVRPFQDCSERYGGALGFERIVRLSPTEYAAEPLGRFAPGNVPGLKPGAIGLHTYNRGEGIEALDACWREPVRVVG